MTVQLHLLSFDAPADTVAGWLRAWLDQQPKAAGVWLLLEQMHRFDFAGPDAAALGKLVTPDAIGTYGLRGRLFWDIGQIEWRRMDDHRLRVVAMTEDASVPAVPKGVEPLSEGLSLEPVASRLIMWGWSQGKGDNGRFRELRVAGSGCLDYPEALQQSARSAAKPVYPALPIRSYVDDGAREMFRRFMPPAVLSEQELLKQEV